MYDVRDFMERALRQQRNLLKIYEKRVNDLPEGTLSVSRSKGKLYYRKHCQGIGKAYQNCDLDLFSVQKRKDNRDWGNRPYQRNTGYPEQLTQKTQKGDFVRSKSEVIIANAYFAKGVQYRYEEIIKVGGRTFAPDFSILVPRLNKVKYHEHFGMMHDPHYRETALQKIGTYVAAGFRPYEDILFTFDDLNGNIDAQVLDVLIDEFML